MRRQQSYQGILRLKNLINCKQTIDIHIIKLQFITVEGCCFLYKQNSGIPSENFATIVATINTGSDIASDACAIYVRVADEEVGSLAL